MTTSELKQRLKQKNISPSEYSIGIGGLPNEMLCLVNDEGWCVYYSERGRKTGLKRFDTESAACIYVYEKLTGI